MYVHGLGGNAQKAENYRKNCPGYDVIGVDYEGYVPNEVLGDIRACYDKMCEKYPQIYLIANSIGAYFSMLALRDCKIAKALFISPVLDMERVILDMMSRADVSEQELREKGEVVLRSGMVLSWKYLCFVRENPITWNVPTEILYAGHDNIISRHTVDEFVNTHGAKLTVMEDGEHWFHTEEQLAFLDEWMRKAVQ